MAKVSVVYKEVQRPIEKVILELTPEEVEYIRYWAALALASRLDKLLPKTGAGYHPEKCFLED